THNDQQRRMRLETVPAVLFYRRIITRKARRLYQPDQVRSGAVLLARFGIMQYVHVCAIFHCHPFATKTNIRSYLFEILIDHNGKHIKHKEMRILVTNDDGIYSPGIKALATIASQFGEVVVVAPDVEQSSMGHAVTHSR